MAVYGRKQWKLQEFTAHEANVNSVALGRKSGRVLVTGGDDKKVNLWAVGKPNCIMTLDGHTTAVECVRFSSTEELVCAGSLSGALKVWDLEAAKIIKTLTGHKANIRFVDFHPYGDLLVSGSQDSNIKLWDIRHRGCVITYKGHSSSVNCVKFSPDGQWIASGGDDGLVKVWDLKSGKLLKELPGHKGPVSCVEFHPNEFLLASGSSDRRVNFWDLENFKPVSTTEADCGAIRCIYFDNDGKCLYAGSQDTLKVYGWEPARTHDTLILNWGKVHDISCAQSQVIGASFHSTMVSLYVVDWSTRGDENFSRHPPVPTHMSNRRSFDRNSRFLGTRESLSLVKRSEDSDPMTTDPEDELGPELCITSETDYQAIFQPRSRELSRTPPPFEPPAGSNDLSSVPDDGVIRSNRDSSRGRNGFAGSTTQMPPPAPPTRNHLPSHASVRSRSESRTENRRRRSPPSHKEPSAMPNASKEYYAGNNSDDQEKMVRWSGEPASAIAGRLGLMKHCPSESSIVQQLSAGLPRGNAESLTGLPPGPSKLRKSSTVESGMQKKSAYGMEPISAGGGEKPVPMNADHSFGLNFEDFLPKKFSTTATTGGLGFNLAADLSEAEVISSLVKGHNPVLTILQSRQKHVQLINTTWGSRDAKAAVEVAASLEDTSAFVDFLSALNYKPAAWNLDLCVVVLPEIHKFLDSKFESHVMVACGAIKLILKNFASLIKANVGTPHQTVGVDISREERHKKCMVCYQTLVSIRSYVMKKQTLSGNLGRTFRDLLHLLVTYLD